MVAQVPPEADQPSAEAVNMYYIYVLRSKKNNKRYIGFTSKDPKIRLKEHNSGTDDWTRQNSPFELVYQEKFYIKREAMKREKFLKSGQGRKFLDLTVPE